MSNISDGLKTQALNFLKSVISDATAKGVSDGKTSGYNSGYTKGYADGTAAGSSGGYDKGKAEGYELGLAEGRIVGYNNGKTDGYNLGLSDGKAVGYESGYTRGYLDGANECEEGGEVTPPTPPTGDTSYDSERAKANLQALRTGSYVFAIMDKFGNAYATVDDWKAKGSKEVLGIGYASATLELCMGIKKTSSFAFGGDGVKFNSKVCTTKQQWHKNTGELTAFDDYSGASNTEGIMEGCNDSLAEKCYAVTFPNGRNGYMPGCGELRLYCKYFKQVDALLEGVGGDVLKTVAGAQVMHASTCKDNSYVWAVRYYNEGDAQPQANLKTKKLPTRVFVQL